MKTEIFVTLQVEGMHYWPGAAEYSPAVSFLASPHRHIFHITAYKIVKHNDRDVEFILWKRLILNHLRDTYGVPENDMLYFGRMSCEDIAVEICSQFKCSKVIVSEDNENGAIVYE